MLFVRIANGEEHTNGGNGMAAVRGATATVFTKNRVNRLKESHSVNRQHKPLTPSHLAPRSTKTGIFGGVGKPFRQIVDDCTLAWNVQCLDRKRPDQGLEPPSPSS